MATADAGALRTDGAALGAGALWALRDLVSGDYLLPLAVALCVVPVFALQDYVEGVARSFNWTVLAIAPPFILRQALVALSMCWRWPGGRPRILGSRSPARCSRPSRRSSRRSRRCGESCGESCLRAGAPIAY